MERACGDVSLGQYRVLAMVAGGGERAGGLADRLALGKPAVTSAVNGLEARGLVKRTAVASDRRVTQLDITPKGEAALARAEADMAAKLTELLELSGASSALAAINSLGEAIDRQRSQRRDRRMAMAGRESAITAGRA